MAFIPLLMFEKVARSAIHHIIQWKKLHQRETREGWLKCTLLKSVSFRFRFTYCEPPTYVPASFQPDDYLAWLAHLRVGDVMLQDVKRGFTAKNILQYVAMFIPIYCALFFSMIISIIQAVWWTRGPCTIGSRYNMVWYTTWLHTIRQVIC